MVKEFQGFINGKIFKNGFPLEATLVGHLHLRGIIINHNMQDHHKHLYMANQEYHKPFFYSRMIIINQNMQDYHKHLYRANQEYHKPFFYTRMIIIIHFRRIIINLERH